LASGKTVEIQSAPQTAATTVLTIPDVVDGADALVLVDTQQTLTNKTLTSPVVTNIDIQSSFRIKLPTAEPTEAEIGKLYYHAGRLKISNSASIATAHDKVVTETSTDSFQNKSINATANTITEIDPAASLRTILANADKVVKYDASGIPSVSKIVNANVDAAAGIEGSKLADNSIPAAKLSAFSSADLAGKVNDETGSGSLVFATSPTLTTPSIDQINAPSQTLTVSGTGALRLPLGTEANRPAGTAATLKGMIRYNDEADAFEGYNELSGWSSLGGGGTTDRVTQASHGFVVGDVLYLEGSTYTKAVATAANTAEVAGVVSRVIDSSTFELTLSGEISGLLAANFTEAALPATGEALFLSTTAGKMTVTEPSTVGHISIPVGIASGSGSMYVGIKRGVVVGAANARTTISVANAAATSVVNVTNYNSLKLEGELFVNRGSGNQRAYYTVEATKNGAGVWQVSASYTGDDILYGTLPTWDVAANQLQITMPLVTGTFNSASLTYSLNAPAVGASLPLSIDSTALNIVAEAPLSYRNRIINGDMRIDQRNSGAAVTTEAYCLDRWRTWMSTATVFSAQQNAGSVTPPAGYSNYLGCTITNAVTPTAGQRWSIQQAIEGFNLADLGWGTASAQTVTLSFWVRSSLTGTFGGVIRNSAGNRAYPFTYSISSANTWEQKTVTIAGDTTGTWLTNNGVGLALVFSLGAGSTLLGTAGAWAGSDLWSATGSVNVVGTNLATFYLTGVQLEVGSKASAFERRPYGMELALCQRYCFVNRIALFNYIGFGQMETASVCNVVMFLPQIMRAQPLLESYTNPSSVQFESSAGMATGFTAIGVNCTAVSTSYRLQFTGGSGGTATAVGAVRSQAAEVRYVLAAEL